MSGNRAGVALAALALMAAGARGQEMVRSVDVLGQALVGPSTAVDGDVVGGLSGLEYDRGSGRFFAVSDAQSLTSPPRFYTLEVGLDDGALRTGDVAFRAVTRLLRPDGTPFPAGAVDAEGIALAPDGSSVYISSEAGPSVGRYDLATGRQLGLLDLPAKFAPEGGGSTGIRSNLAFESLTIAPSQRYLFTATENALAQDGPAASIADGSPSRILRYDADTGAPGAEFLYQTDPVAAAPNPAGGQAVAGLVDLLALSDDRLLALERSFSEGVGFSARLYEVDLAAATDIREIQGLIAAGMAGIAPARKRLVADLGSLGFLITNLEGMAFGPDLADGRKTLLLVADNDFVPFLPTQFVALGLTVVPEPSSVVLTALGAAGLLLAGRGRRRLRGS